MKTMKKTTKHFMGLMCLTGFMLTSCTPRIVTHIYNERAPLPVDSVHIFLPGERVPSTAVVVGDVAVKDRGTTTKCNYDYVVQLGKETTAKHGGNALQIAEHRLPSYKSTCHQIFGNMLYMTPEEMYSTMTDTLSFLASDDTFGAQVVYTERRPNPKNVIKLSVGPSRITSKVYSPYGTVHKKMGLDVMLNYEHIGYRNFGFGFTTAFNRTTYERPDLLLRRPRLRHQPCDDEELALGRRHRHGLYHLQRDGWRQWRRLRRTDAAGCGVRTRQPFRSRCRLEHDASHLLGT